MTETAAKPATDADEKRFRALSHQLRCLVCQNETLADSQADLAEDLRNEVREQIAQGKTDQQIKDYLVQRYGDFVLYKPPLKETTWPLWGGPFALLAVGAGAWWMVQRRQRLNRRPDAPEAAPPDTGGAPGPAAPTSGAPDGDAERARAKARRLLD